MMEITHNAVNKSIDEIKTLFAKRQRGAKYNKTRQIRAVISTIKTRQNDDITLKEVWFYFVVWMKSRAKTVKNHIIS